MDKNKLTLSISKINLLIILIILALLFLPIPSYQLKPVPCPSMFRADGKGSCPPVKKGWVLTKPLFFRITDLIKNNFFYPPQEGQSEAVPGDAGVIDSQRPGE